MISFAQEPDIPFALLSRGVAQVLAGTNAGTWVRGYVGVSGARLLFRPTVWGGQWGKRTPHYCIK